MAKPWNQPPEVASGHSQTVEKALDSQTLAAFGAACIDHGTTTAGLHANQEAVGTGAADFGRLVSAFHLEFLTGSVLILPLFTEQISVKSPRTQSGEPRIIANFPKQGNTLGGNQILLHELRPSQSTMWIKY